MQPKNKKPQKNSLRIIAGQWRGRKLTIHNAEGLRPTGDRIRETLFNWLAPWLPGSRCLDLFAGTGALGLEALSRGAAAVTFVEQNRAVANSLQANLQTLNCQTATIANNDALIWLDQTDSAPFDIIFVDPPFAKSLWTTTLTKLAESQLLGSNSLVYIESPRDQAITVPPIWQRHKHKQAGAISYGVWLACDTHPTKSLPENV